MAKRTTADTGSDAPDTVQLHCEDLGQTRDFAPAHAKALLALQESRGLTGPGSWQPLGAADSAAA